MHYIGSVVLEGFYADEERRRGKIPLDKPVVVTRNKMLLDLDEQAKKRGLNLQMTLGEAKPILDGKGDICPWEEERYREAQSKWLEVCAEFSDVIEPDDQHSAYLDLSGHGKPLEIAHRLTTELKARHGFKARCGVANAKWVARTSSRIAPLSKEALWVPRRFVSDLPIDALIPVPVELLKRLKFLGYRTIKDLHCLSLKTLQEHFGEVAFDIKRAAIGGGDAEVAPLYPPKSRARRFGYEGMPETREQFENGLRNLSQKIGKDLYEDDLAGTELHVLIESEDCSILSLKRIFTKPIASPTTLWNAVKLLVPEQLPENICAVRIRLPHLKKAERVQLEIAGQRSKQDANSAVLAFQKVKATFGDNSISLASMLPEERWQKVRKEWKKANGWAWL